MDIDPAASTIPAVSPLPGFRVSRMAMVTSILLWSFSAKYDPRIGGWTVPGVLGGLVMGLAMAVSLCKSNQRELADRVRYGWPLIVLLLIGYGYCIHDDPAWVLAVNVLMMPLMLMAIRWHYKFMPEWTDPETVKVENPETW